MRPVAAALVLLASLAPLAPLAQAQEGSPAATLTIDVQVDHQERMTLGFGGLSPLTQYKDICLPEGARETRVYDDVGDLEHEARDEDGRRYIDFRPRSDKATIEMARGALDEAERPVFSGDANFCVPARAHVEVVVRVPEAHTLFFLSEGAITSAREGRATNDGPMHVFYSFEAPLDAEAAIVAFDEGPFRVFAHPSLEPQAREVAGLAAAPYRASLAEAGLDAPFDVLRVLFAPATPLAWEAGHYGGRGYVTVKDETLSGDATTGYPYSPVKVLVHEAFHAASFPYGRGEVGDTVAWWLEGTARLAERQVDATMPNATRHCERSAMEIRCWDFDDRIPRASLETGYDASFAFAADWEPSLPQSEDTRRFYYGYSEYVVASWIARHGGGAYRAAWDEVEAAFLRGEGCPCEDGWIEGVLGHDGALFAPWADVKAADPDRFETLVKPYVKDEEALQRELDARANPFAGVPLPAAAAFAAIALAALARRR